MEIDRSLRAARAAVFAAACVGVSAAGHVWMSGCAVPPWALLVAMLSVGCAGYALAGRQRGFVPIAGLMLVGEFGLHLLFGGAQRATAGPTPSMSGMASAPPLPGMIMPRAVPASAWLCVGTVHGFGTSGGHGGSSPTAWLFLHGAPGMLAVHVAAGLLSAFWLRGSEAATFRLLLMLAASAVPLLVRVWSDAPSVADRTAGVPDDRDARVPTCGRLLGHLVVRRGPPARVFLM